MRVPLANRSGAGRHAAEANMTPMIDVVFLLIIFFLVSSHLARRETRLALDLPSARTSAPDADTAPRLTVNVTADGAVTLGAQPVTLGELTERLSQAAAQAGAAPRVRLRSDRAVDYARVEPVLAACVAAGVEDVSLAVLGAAPAAGGPTP
ncbi:biopolymer transporter ExbD [Botrimarina sp.]|uniref:ExbD/TolR family protein n=1 Tax=Botrimarina sp. TaxID=2795802 RepID=UPI0032ECBF07